MLRICRWMLVFAGLASHAAPCLAADAANGKKVAKLVCAGCHDISDDLKAAPARQPGVPPAFLTVAAQRNLDADRLLKFLSFPHGEMDNLVMTRQETRDVVGYIMGLSRGRAP